MKNSLHPHAFVSTRDHLNYGMLKNGPNSYYMPPLSEDSTFFVDCMGMAISKQFPYKNEFNFL